MRNGEITSLLKQFCRAWCSSPRTSRPGSLEISQLQKQIRICGLPPWALLGQKCFLSCLEDEQSNYLSESLFGFSLSPPSLATPQCSGCYGSLAGNDSYTAGPPPSGTATDSAPLLSAAGGSELSNHHSSYPAAQN